MATSMYADLQTLCSSDRIFEVAIIVLTCVLGRVMGTRSSKLRDCLFAKFHGSPNKFANQAVVLDAHPQYNLVTQMSQTWRYGTHGGRNWSGFLHYEEDIW